MCELQRIVGFQKEVKGGLIFSRPSTLFYIAGQTGVFHSLKDNVQKFFPIMEKNEFTAMALGAKNLLALASKGHTPKLTVYNLKSTEKFTLKNPNSSKNVTEYVWISFSGDKEYIAAQGGKPSWPFEIWNLESRRFLGTFVPFRLEYRAKIFKFSFEPRDSSNIVVIGQYFLRIYKHRCGLRFKEVAFHNLERLQKKFHSITWLQKTEKFAVGTSDGMILIFEGQLLLQEIPVYRKLGDVPRILNKVGNPDDKNITFVLSTKLGIICSYGANTILYLHWKIDKRDFNIVASVHIPKRVEGITEDSKIVQIALNSSQDILAAATDDGQLLTFSFKIPGLLDTIGYEVEFDVLLDQQHRTPIICADTASNRSAHVTCSRSTLILWDYQKRQLLVWKKFYNEEIRSVSIHPLGINLLVGFSKSCKMYNILYDKLEEIREFDTKDAQVKFAGGGHMIAFANASCIEIYSSLSLEKWDTFKLENPEGEIKCLLWEKNDYRLLTLSTAGKINEWDVILKKKIWSYSSSDSVVFTTLYVSDDSIYVATSDFKIWIFNNYEKTAEIDTQVKVTSILVIEQLLLAGNEHGMVCGYELPFSGDILFETYYHQRSIINMTVKKNGKLLLVTGEEGAITMWSMDYELKESTPLFDEFLFEQEMYDSQINRISQLERELKEQTAKAKSKKSEQLQLQETERTELEKYYSDIQNQLRQTIIDLMEEKYNLQLDMEKVYFEHAAALYGEKDENYADFEIKLNKEEENLKKLAEERVQKIQEYESRLLDLREEIEVSNEKVEIVRKKNENRLEELEEMLQNERDAREEMMKQDEAFYRDLENKAKGQSEETNFKFAAELEEARGENEVLFSEWEKNIAALEYEKECSRTLDAEFGKKKRMYDCLKEIAKLIKVRIADMNSEVERKESMLEDKLAMINELDEDAKEMKHMSSEANWRLGECKKKLKEKSEELSNLLTEQQKLEREQRLLNKKLKSTQREHSVLDEKLRSTEKSILDSKQKLLRAQLLLDRYRKEFIEATKDIESPATIRWAILKLFHKTVLKGRIKEEEVFVADTDPFLKYCRQRDHYEALINNVIRRKQEIQAAFRKTYSNLAKENSDWVAFLEALHSDINQKQERIQVLESCVRLPAKDFIKDSSKTQKRFNDVYEKLKLIETEEDEAIQKRIDLIEEQTIELQRIHGLMVVDKSGKVIKKIGL